MKKKIAFIGCSSKKMSKSCVAQEMYSPSTLFSLTLKYCKKMKFDKIYILSAKYHVIDLNHLIKPYELTLKKMEKEKNRMEYVSKRMD